MKEYASFRQRLDAVLRTLDVNQLSEFLIAEGQWSEGTPSDEEFAMWMMVAGSPSLQNLHERAYEWLMMHGHEADAVAFLARDKKPSTKDGANRGKSGSSSGMPKFSGKKPNNTPKSRGSSKGKRER